MRITKTAVDAEDIVDQETDVGNDAVAVCLDIAPVNCCIDIAEFITQGDPEYHIVSG